MAPFAIMAMFLPLLNLRVDVGVAFLIPISVEPGIPRLKIARSLDQIRSLAESLKASIQGKVRRK